MATSSTILAALAAAIRTITRLGGYNTEIRSENVFTLLDGINQAVQQTSQGYPRIFCVSDGASYGAMPSHTIVKQESFTVIAVFAKDTSNPSDIELTTQVSNFIDDFEAMIDRNLQLGGSDEVLLQKCATDVGKDSPEGVCVFELVIEYRRRFT